MKSRTCIPKGLLKIVRRFNAGNDTQRRRVPKGRLRAPLVQPSLRDSISTRRYPALKRRAIFTRSLRDAIPALALLFLLLGALTLVPSAQALIMVGQGNQPVQDPGWPEGALALANLQSRVGWFEGPPFGGGDWQFLYRGDNQSFAQALEKFAAIRAPALDVVVHDGPESNQFLKDEQNTNSDTRIDWSFDVWVPESWDQLYNNTNLTILASNRGYRQPVDPPRLDVFIGGGGQLDWANVTVRNNVRVRDERASASGVDLSGGSMIRATITDMATGQPVAGAHLILDKLTYFAGTNGHWEKVRLAEAASDSSGVAQIEKIQTNNICVSVVAEGYAPRRIDQRILRRPELLKLAVELARAASIDGIVIDDAGKPVPGVNVRPSIQLSSNGVGYDNGLHYEPDKWTVTTDAEGRFEFKELPTGYVQFYALARGYYFTDLRTTFNVPSNNIVLHLHSAGDVSVAVTDKDGKPISKFEGNPLLVGLDPKDGGRPGMRSGGATVNAEGLCEFKDMPPGEYRVSSRPNPGHASPDYPSEQLVTVTAGKRATITLVYHNQK